MKLTNSQIERRIREAVENETPDALPRILLRIENEEGNNAMEHTEKLPDIIDGTRPRRKTRILRWAGSIAASLAIIFCAVLGFRYFTPESVISFDVNPSIELKVNRAERVLSAMALNADAQAILGGMDLRNTDLNVATNALIGSMVMNGYIDEARNSILISVDSINETKGAELTQRLMANVNTLLHAYSVEGAVLSQTVSEDDRLTGLAKRHDITLGKAALVDLLVSQDETLDFDSLASLSINDLNLLIASREAALSGVNASGHASSGAYIGEDNAVEIACAHANIDRSAAASIKIEMDYDDGRMLYEIEIRTDSTEYEYDIDALTGEVLGYEREAKNRPAAASTVPASLAPVGSPSAIISPDEAIAAALTDAGVSASDIQITKQETEIKRGKTYYDIEFRSGTAKYEYLIDASTGAIVEREVKETPKNQTDSSAQSEEYIGNGRAKSIALKHAGLEGAAVSKFGCKLDRDDGRIVYEIEFIYGGIEYDYEIDAYSGEVLKWESDKD